MSMVHDMYCYFNPNGTKKNKLEVEADFWYEMYKLCLYINDSDGEAEAWARHELAADLYEKHTGSCWLPF